MAYDWYSLRQQGRYADNDDQPVGGMQATNIQTAGQNIPLGGNRSGYGPRSTASVPNQQSTGAQPPIPPVPNHPHYKRYLRELEGGRFTGTFDDFVSQQGWKNRLGNALGRPNEPRPTTYQKQRGLARPIRPGGGGTGRRDARYAASVASGGAPGSSSPL